MSLSDFNTLAEAQAHTETRYQFFNNNTMNSVLAQMKLLAPLEVIIGDPNHPFFNEAKALLTSQEFNFRQDSATGLLQIDMLDAMIAAPVTVDMSEGVTVDLTIQLTQLKQTCLYIANYPFKPHESATQEQFDAAKAIGETVTTEVKYDGTDNPHSVTAGKRLVKFLVTLDEVAQHDCVVTVKGAGKGDVSETDYIDLTREFKVTIRKGQKGVYSIDQAAAYFPRLVQFTATIDKANTPFSLDVITA